MSPPVSTLIQLFLRFDDYCATSPPAIEQGVVAALRRAGMQATFAVVPALTEGRYHDPGERGTVPMDDAKLAFLRAAVADGVVDAALHGWNHRTRMTSPPHAEFDGMDPAAQMDVIGRGAALLREWTGVAPSVFVPPWNRYDAATLTALAAHGFRCLSANRYGPVGPEPLMFAPITIEMPDLQAAVAAARDSADPNPVIGVLMHPYDFVESGDDRATMTLETFAGHLEWLRRQPDVRVLSIAALTADNPTMDAGRYGASRPHAVASIEPPFVVRAGTLPYYASRLQALQARGRRVWKTLSTHGAGLLAGSVGGAVAALLDMAAITAVGSFVLLAALLGRAVMRREIYFRTAFAMAMLAGALLGTVLGR